MLTMNVSRSLAGSRTNRDDAAERERVSLESAIVSHASCLLLSVPDLSTSDRQFLYDIRRREARFPIQSWARLAAITRRSLRPAHRAQMHELFKRAEVQPCALTDLIEASLAETEAQAIGDVAVQRFLFDRTAANQREAKASMLGHRECIDALVTMIERIPVAA